MQKISFIIPMYNVMSYIEECIASILAQKDDSWEMILVDDGSTDATVKICEKYARNDKRIKIICQKNAGPGMARNTGLRVANGEWISFVDGDDWLENDFLEKLSSYMARDYDFVMYSYNCVCGNKKIKANDAQKEIVLLQEQFRLMVCDSIDTEKRLPDIAGSRSQLWTKIYRKQFLLDNQLLQETELRTCEDVMFNLRVYNLATQAIYVPYSLYNYRVLSDSTCHRYCAAQLQQIMKLLEITSEFLENTNLKLDKRALYEKRVLVSLVNICKQDMCHKDNHSSYLTRRKEFLKLCSVEPFCSALSVKTICKFSAKKQICMWLVKFRLFSFLCFFLRRNG